MGDTAKLASANEDVPTKEVYEASAYHFQTALLPNIPPVCESVLLEPAHVVVVLAKTLVAAEELVLTTTVTK